MEKTKIEQRTELGLKAIQSQYGTDDGEFSATLFISHHLEEIEETYWKDTYGSKNPDPLTILKSLILIDHWNSNDNGNGSDTFDFGLAGNISNYLLSVRFNENGEVDEISMES